MFDGRGRVDALIEGCDFGVFFERGLIFAQVLLHGDFELIFLVASVTGYAAEMSVMFFCIEPKARGGCWRTYFFKPTWSAMSAKSGFRCFCSQALPVAMLVAWIFRVAEIMRP